MYYFTCLHELVDSYVDFAGVTNILNHFACKFTLKEHLRTNLMHRKRRALSLGSLLGFDELDDADSAEYGTIYQEKDICKHILQ